MTTERVVFYRLVQSNPGHGDYCPGDQHGVIVGWTLLHLCSLQPAQSCYHSNYLHWSVYSMSHGCNKIILNFAYKLVVRKQMGWGGGGGGGINAVKRGQDGEEARMVLNSELY